MLEPSFYLIIKLTVQATQAAWAFDNRLIELLVAAHTGYGLKLCCDVAVHTTYAPALSI